MPFANGQIQFFLQLLILQNMVLGWILAGKINAEHLTATSCRIRTNAEALKAFIDQLWELDEVKTTKKPLSVIHRQCGNHFAQNTTKNREDCFIVRIRFHQTPNTLCDLHATALNQFPAPKIRNRFHNVSKLLFPTSLRTKARNFND